MSILWFWNTVVYVHDIIVRCYGPQKHSRFTKSSGNLEILTSMYVGNNVILRKAFMSLFVFICQFVSFGGLSIEEQPLAPVVLKFVYSPLNAKPFSLVYTLHVCVQMHPN